LEAFLINKTMEFTRIKSDINGNPRYVTHFLNIPIQGEELTVSQKYDLAVKKAKKLGGRKYHTKSFGGGIVFSSYNLNNLEKEINEL
jgi:hypothetical protein